MSTTTGQAEKAGQIEARVHRLHQMTEVLLERSQALMVRLDPVLQPTTDVPCEVAAEPERAGLAPLANELDHKLDDLVIVRDRLSDMLERLEL